MITNRIEEIVSLPIPEDAIRAIAEFINNNDMMTVENRRYDLVGEHYVSIQEIDTVPYTANKLEFHGKYADIQCIFSGKERFLVANSSDSSITQPYSVEKDVGFSIADNVKTVDVEEGYFVYFAPGELHGPGISAGEESCHCKKAVFKVRIGA